MASDVFMGRPGIGNGGVRGPVQTTVAGASLVSIVIPCCGMLEYTKLCVPSVLKHSRSPIELIFLDIGSLDGTSEYLAGVAAACPGTRVEVVRAPTDLAIKDACKEAIARTRGEFIVLLNNDTVVVPGWLHQLTGLASARPDFGAIGPMSNYAAVEQLIELVPYRIDTHRTTPLEGRHGANGALVDVEAVSQFASELLEKKRGNWTEIERLGGFCMLIKREAFNRMGSIDPWTDLSLFDTDILRSKLRQAGYTLGLCRDLFIHHFGVRTFAHGAPTDQNKEKNGAAAR